MTRPISQLFSSTIGTQVTLFQIKTFCIRTPIDRNLVDRSAVQTFQRPMGVASFSQYHLQDHLPYRLLACTAVTMAKQVAMAYLAKCQAHCYIQMLILMKYSLKMLLATL